MDFWLSGVESIQEEIKNLSTWLFYTKEDLLNWWERYCIDYDIIQSDFIVSIGYKNTKIPYKKEVIV